MHHHSKDIALDVDGVLLDCDGGFAAVGTHVLGRPVVKVGSTYNMKDRYNLSAEETARVWKAMEHHEAGWGNFEALPGARNAFFRLKAMGYRIHLVTAIEETLRTLREACMALHGMVPDSIHCAGDMHASKTEILRQLNPVAFADDRLKHLHEAPFIPNRIFIDNGDEQGPFVVDEDIIHVKSLQQWVNAWELCQGQSLRKSFRRVG